MTSLKDVERMKEIARQVGIRTKQKRDSLHLEFKADGSYVTELDRENEETIKQSLLQDYLDVPFLGEEFGGTSHLTGRLWVVDPIDGTTNFVTGLPEWGISIGLCEDGEPVAGVFYMPCTDEMFWGVRGFGAYCNEKKLQAPDPGDLHEESTLGFTSTALKTLPISGLSGRLRCFGSIAAEFAYTAKGALGCIIGCNEHSWDIAATLCIAREAGCNLAYLNGSRLDFRDVLTEGCMRSEYILAVPAMIERMIPLLRVP